MPEYDETEYQQLTSELSIDKDFLEGSELRQAHLYHHAGEGHAYAKSIKDTKSFRLEVVKAELDKIIREEWEAEDTKFTEKKVEEEVKRDKDYQKAYKEYLDASLNTDKWAALRDAFRQKGEMLKLLDRDR